MKTNWTFALAAIAFILGSTPVEARPGTKTESAQYRLPDGGKVIGTGAQQTNGTVVIVTEYKPNGTVLRSTCIEEKNRR